MESKKKIWNGIENLDSQNLESKFGIEKFGIEKFGIEIWNRKIGIEMELKKF